MRTMAKQSVIGLLIALACLATFALHADEPSATVAPAKGTLATRLAEAKYVGLQRDKELGGYRVFIYTETQQKRNLEELATYRKESQALREKVAQLNERRQELQKFGDRMDDLNALNTEHNELFRKEPRSEFASSVQLHQVVRVGEDFLELRPEESGRPWLLPLRFICAVVLPEQETDKPAE